MRSAEWVFMQVEIVDGILRVILRQETLGFVRTVNREPVEREPDDAGMSRAFVIPRSFHAHGVFVVMIRTLWAGVPATTIQPPHRVRLEDVVEGVEENHSVGRHANRPHRECSVFVLSIHRNMLWVDFRVNGDVPRHSLLLNVRRVAIQHPPAVREGSRGVIGHVLAVHDDMVLGDRDHEVVGEVLVLFDKLPIKIFVPFSQPRGHVSGERSFELVGLVEQLIRVGMIELFRELTRFPLRIEIPSSSQVNQRTEFRLRKTPVSIRGWLVFCGGI